MSKFNSLIEVKYQQLNEAPIPGTAPVTSPAPIQGANQTASPQSPQTQTQPVTQPQQSQQQDPAQQLGNILNQVKFGDPNVAIKVLNDALTKSGNRNDQMKFWPNVAYDAKAHQFKYVQPQAQPQQATQPIQQGQVPTAPQPPR